MEDEVQVDVSSHSLPCTARELSTFEQDFNLLSGYRVYCPRTVEKMVYRIEKRIKADKSSCLNFQCSPILVKGRLFTRPD